MERGSLKPLKHVIAGFVDELIACGQENRSENRRGRGRQTPKDEKARKRKKEETDEVNATKSSKIVGKKAHNARVDRLKALCRAATVPIPPNVYKKNKTDNGLAQALEKLLEKHGLNYNSTSHDTSRVKAKLQLQRDLDGIDTSNIITEGRRSRSGSNARRIQLTDGIVDSEEEDLSETSVEDGNDDDVESVSAHEHEQQNINISEEESIQSEISSESNKRKKSAPALSKTAGKRSKKTKKMVDWSDDDTDDEI